MAKTNHMAYHMCEASNEFNEHHLEYQIHRFLESGKKEYKTDSVTYKKGTNILEESQQLLYALRLAEEGVDVTICESKDVTKQLKHRYGDIFNYE